MNYREYGTKILEEHRKVIDTLNEEDLRRFIETVKKYDRIFCIGVGREGMETRAFAMRLMHMGKEVHWIWDDTTPHIGEGDLLIQAKTDVLDGQQQKQERPVNQPHVVQGTDRSQAFRKDFSCFGSHGG